MIMQRHTFASLLEGSRQTCRHDSHLSWGSGSEHRLKDDIRHHLQSTAQETSKEARTMLPHVNAQDRDVARISNASVERTVITWRGSQ